MFENINFEIFSISEEPKILNKYVPKTYKNIDGFTFLFFEQKSLLNSREPNLFGSASEKITFSGVELYIKNSSSFGNEIPLLISENFIFIFRIYNIKNSSNFRDEVSLLNSKNQLKNGKSYPKDFRDEVLSIASSLLISKNLKKLGQISKTMKEKNILNCSIYENNQHKISDILSKYFDYELSDIFMFQKYRGKNLSKKLLSFALNFFYLNYMNTNLNIILWTTYDNIPANKLYQSLNFNKINNYYLRKVSEEIKNTYNFIGPNSEIIFYYF